MSCLQDSNNYDTQLLQKAFILVSSEFSSQFMRRIHTQYGHGRRTDGLPGAY